jgi:hypothetical protein
LSSTARAIAQRTWAGLVFAAVCCAAAHGQSGAPESPSVTPYRPSVSTPAELSAPGYLEFELGGLKVPAPQRRDSLPYSVKFAFDEDWGLRVGGDAWVRNYAAGGSYRTGPGDTAVVLKHRVELTDVSAFGVELGWAVPTARSGVGAGAVAYTVNAIYSQDFGATHLDINIDAARSDTVDPGTGYLATGWAAALSRALDDRWEVAGEFSGTNQRGVAATSQVLFSLAYTVSRSLVLDAGLARSLRAASSSPSLFVGFTMLGPRLF